MAEQSWPHPDGPIANTEQWRAAARLWRGTGVIQGAEDELEAESVPEELEIRIKAGRAWVDGHYYELPETDEFEVATADPTNPRIDRVVIEYKDEREAPATAGAFIKILVGTPASEPVAPALTQEDGHYQLPLARFTVGAVATEVTDVIDERVMSFPLQVQFVDNTTQRDDIPVESRSVVWRRDIERFEAWDRENDEWVPGAPDHAHSLGSLDDVNTDGASDGDALVFNDSESRWEPGESGGMVHIETLTGRDISFQNIPQTFRHLKLIGWFDADTEGSIIVRFNNVSSAGSYERSTMSIVGSGTPGTTYSASTTFMIIPCGDKDVGNTGGAIEMTCPNYTDTGNGAGTMHGVSGGRTYGLGSGGLNSPAAINRIDLTGSESSTTHNRVSLYGIR